MQVVRLGEGYGVSWLWVSEYNRKSSSTMDCHAERSEVSDYEEYTPITHKWPLHWLASPLGRRNPQCFSQLSIVGVFNIATQYFS